MLGYDGVFRTTDGGGSWERQLDAGVVYRSAAFLGGSRGWIGAVDHQDVLYETSDGGGTWRSVADRIVGPPVAGVCGLWVVDGSWVVGVGSYAGPPRLIETRNGGALWESRDLSAHAGALVDVVMRRDGWGVSVGGTGPSLAGRAVVLRTSDGGGTWARVYEGTHRGEIAWKISFPSRDTGYVSVESLLGAFVLKTTDEGRTWGRLRVPGLVQLQGIGFISSDVGFVGGRAGAATTGDGGATWQSIANLDNVNRIRPSDWGVTYAAGRRLEVLERE